MIYKVRDMQVGETMRHQGLGVGRLAELENLILKTLLEGGKLPSSLCTIGIELKITLGVLSKPGEPVPPDLEHFQYKIQIKQAVSDIQLDTKTTEES